jgi:hypothetical protein
MGNKVRCWSRRGARPCEVVDHILPLTDWPFLAHADGNKPFAVVLLIAKLGYVALYPLLG